MENPKLVTFQTDPEKYKKLKFILLKNDKTFVDWINEIIDQEIKHNEND